MLQTGSRALQPTLDLRMSPGHNTTMEAVQAYRVSYVVHGPWSHTSSTRHFFSREEADVFLESKRAIAKAAFGYNTPPLLHEIMLLKIDNKHYCLGLPVEIS